MAKNYYEILGVNRESTDDEIKKSYRKIAMKYHPDRNQGNKEAENIFRDASEAYETLSDGEKRKKYNDKLDGKQNNNKEQKKEGKTTTSQTMNGGNINMQDLHSSFERFFGAGKVNTGSSGAESLKTKGSKDMFDKFFDPRKK